ncbi:MAG: NAD(P)H-hydrate epimerase, partial [Verrucomicrobiota bacterium]|nr:NAD(P)H-hydrate epimerase [Verrucomicrobiota bacterium]
MILTSAEMQKLEAKAFASGISAEALMDDAGAQIARAITEFFPAPASALVFFGKGNNGGDALV